MHINWKAAICATASAAIVIGLGELYIARAHAEETAVTVTVDSHDYPVCALEDCSDQPGRVGVWFDPTDGRRWLSLGDYSVSVTPGPDSLAFEPAFRPPEAVFVPGCGWDVRPNDNAGCAD